MQVPRVIGFANAQPVTWLSRPIMCWAAYIPTQQMGFLQGSVIIPFFFIVAASDLPPNVMADPVVYYADDTTLLSKH
ncbi:hypothetical protein J6590_032457 [Homalodisca vitripennis]|nr:hypothetical protein J6590_032457 [Homalodisca vitripennis]